MRECVPASREAIQPSAENMMTDTTKNILIVDFSLYKDAIRKIYNEAGYHVEACESAFEAMQKLKAFDFDLVVSEIELPGDNAFDLYNYINTNYPYIPAIMTTDKNIDTFFERIVSEGIGNVLCKPLKKEELLNLTQKLIGKKDIFGLENYLSDVLDMKKIRITSSRHIQKAVEMTLETVEEWGFTIENRMILHLIMNELIINAVYHSHGLTAEKERREQVQLKEGQFVDIFFGNSANTIGISINDYNGRLSKMKILETIHHVINQNQLILEASETGEDISSRVSLTGRGIDLVRRLCDEYYFIIKHGIRTEIILLFDKRFRNDDENRSSIKIIEDFGV